MPSNDVARRGSASANTTSPIGNADTTRVARHADTASPAPSQRPVVAPGRSRRRARRMHTSREGDPRRRGGVRHGVGGVVAERRAREGEEDREAGDGGMGGGELARDRIREDDERGGEERAHDHRRAEPEADGEEQRVAGRKDAGEGAVADDEEPAAEVRRRLGERPGEASVRKRAALEEVRRRVHDARTAAEVHRDVAEREERGGEAGEREEPHGRTPRGAETPCGPRA